MTTTQYRILCEFPNCLKVYQGESCIPVVWAYMYHLEIEHRYYPSSERLLRLAEELSREDSLVTYHEIRPTREEKG